MCTKCCAYEGASPFVRKCGSAAGARREGGAKGRESVDARRNEMYYVGRGEEKEEEESGAKEREKKGRSPAKEMKWSRGEKHGRICTHLRVQICAGKCIRAEINCLLMNMCREFDLIFQM